MRAKKRLLFIGIDSAEPRDLRRMMHACELPTLAKLAPRSAWGNTTTPPGYGDGVIWPSIATGVNAGRHGRTLYRQIVSGTYRTQPFVDDRDLGAPPMWEALSQAGKRCAIVDMVRSPRSDAINGIQISDWLVHDRTGVPRSQPPELIDAVIRRYGGDPVGDKCEDYATMEAGMRTLRDRCLERIAKRTRHILDLIGQEPWDLVMLVYPDAHDVGHMGWHLHDPDHAAFDGEAQARVGDPVRDVYGAIDAAISEVVAAVDEGTTVVVFSGPGMEPLYTGNHLLDEVLIRLERGRTGGTISVHGIARSLVRAVMPLSLRRYLWKRAKVASYAIRESDWGGRTYFQVPNNDAAGCVRINLIGREPNGKVHPGDAYDGLCESLAHDLSALINADTGKPAVERVIRADRVYEGPCLDHLADLLVIWNRDHPILGLSSPKIGEVRGTPTTPRTGDHSPRGFFMAFGPGVVPGEVAEPVSYLDLAATLPAILGVTDLPLDGHPLPMIISAPSDVGRIVPV